MCLLHVSTDFDRYRSVVNVICKCKAGQKATVGATVEDIMMMMIKTNCGFSENSVFFSSRMLGFRVV